MRDTMIFYRSFYDAIKTLSKEEKADIYEAIFEYGLNMKEIDLTGIPKVVFGLVKPVLDSNIKNYVNGSKPKKKRSGSQTEAKPKPSGSETEAYKDKDVDKDENKDNDVDKDKDTYRRFKHLSLTNVEANKIMKEGYTKYELDTILDGIENFANNKKYVSLNLTARNWLKNEYGVREVGKKPKDFAKRSEYLQYCVKNNLTPEQP